MRLGYLLIETNPALPGFIRVRGVGSKPNQFPDYLKYVARFTDLDAALMHFHKDLSRRLVDLDRGLYQISEEYAAAVAEAIELPHRRLFIDPELAQNHIFLDTIERLHRSHQRSARIFDLIGVLALLMLLVTAFLGL
ncbi:MAG: hypothetical protein N838_27425 [Thiohalocapsa sp. PB-PSB1]|jgi:hypothetical protein|nr:MAG: hypothetical protein N838_00610 [Thiohalocapsa sp. PB-PSB1]QQO56543.1 MAG: hypothetical protein N838_27425 [Thiohalocapsa sp. PB-PSB1]HCS91319.1 hypothetical protein [Chromatiaceae bacterium]